LEGKPRTCVAQELICDLLNFNLQLARASAWIFPIATDRSRASARRLSMKYMGKRKYMGKSLREIPHKSSANWVIFFGEKFQVITQTEERGIKFLGVKSSAYSHKILDKPEGLLRNAPSRSWPERVNICKSGHHAPAFSLSHEQYR
jgi:hypothetical protein